MWCVVSGVCGVGVGCWVVGELLLGHGACEVRCVGYVVCVTWGRVCGMGCGCGV